MSLQSILRDGDRQNLWTAAKICWQGSTWWLWLVFGLLVSFLVCWSVGWFLVCWSVFGFWFVTRFCLLVFGLLVSFWFLVGWLGALVFRHSLVFGCLIGFWFVDQFFCFRLVGGIGAQIPRAGLPPAGVARLLQETIVRPLPASSLVICLLACLLVASCLLAPCLLACYCLHLTLPVYISQTY